MGAEHTLSDGKRIAGVFFASTLTILLFFSGYLVFFTPLPLFYLGGRYGRNKWGWGAVLGSVLVFVLYFVLLPRGVDSVKTLFPGQDWVEKDQIIFFQTFGLGYFLYFYGSVGGLSLGLSGRTSILSPGENIFYLLLWGLFLAGDGCLERHLASLFWKHRAII